MAITTKTFPLSLSSTYVIATNLELIQFRNLVFDATDQVSVYLEAIYCNLDIRSLAMQKFPVYDGSETDAEKVTAFYKAQNASQKIGLRILGRKNNTGDWLEKAEIILTNVGRKQNLDLMPLYMTQAGIRIMEINDAIAIRLLDYGNGLLKASDRIELEAVLRIEVEKKNDTVALEARLVGL